MSPDRGAAGKLVGNLYIASKILVEGRNVKVEEVRHEIRTLSASSSSSSSSGSPSTSGTDSAPSTATSARGSGSGTAAPAPSAVPPGVSPLEWKKIVGRLMLTTQQLPNSIGCLPDAFKRNLASAIQKGRQLCAGSKLASAEASKRIEEAARIYRTLTGPSYL